MTSLSDLETPSLIIDLERLKSNTRRFSNICERDNISLRPHLKTAKSLEIARLITRGDLQQGITVSTLAEADYFASGGYKDIL